MTRTAFDAVPATPFNLDTVVFASGLSLAVDQRSAATRLPADHEHIAVSEFDVEVETRGELDAQVFDPHGDFADVRPVVPGYEFAEYTAAGPCAAVLAEIQFVGVDAGRPGHKQE